MLVLRSGETPPKHFTVIVRVMEVTPAYQTPTGNPLSTNTVERDADEVLSLVVRADTLDEAMHQAQEHLETARAQAGEGA